MCVPDKKAFKNSNVSNYYMCVYENNTNPCQELTHMVIPSFSETTQPDD